MPEPIRRLRGRMIRQHYRTAMGCGCTAWCDGYNEGAAEERDRVADILARRPASVETANLAADLGLTRALNDAWDRLHPEDADA